MKPRKDSTDSNSSGKVTENRNMQKSETKSRKSSRGSDTPVILVSSLFKIQKKNSIRKSVNIFIHPKQSLKAEKMVQAEEKEEKCENEQYSTVKLY